MAPTPRLTRVVKLKCRGVEMIGVPHSRVGHSCLSLAKRRQAAHCLERRRLLLLQQQRHATAGSGHHQPWANSRERAEAHRGGLAAGGRLDGSGGSGAVRQGAQPVAQAARRHAAAVAALLG